MVPSSCNLTSQLWHPSLLSAAFDGSKYRDDDTDENGDGMSLITPLS